jgi:hypothetical protein
VVVVGVDQRAVDVEQRDLRQDEPRLGADALRHAREVLDDRPAEGRQVQRRL